MMQEAHERLRWARKKAGFKSAAQAARALGVTGTTYTSHENGHRKFDATDAALYGRRFRVEAGWLLTGRGAPSALYSVPVVGYVSAGDGQVQYAEGHGNFGEAPVPPGGSEKTVAVEVRGDSMRGIADEGWRVYYDDRRDPPNEGHLGRLCVVGLADGRVLVKKVYRGREPGLYDLESTNAATLHDMPVQWAALVTAIIPEYTARGIDRSNGEDAA